MDKVVKVINGYKAKWIKTGKNQFQLEVDTRDFVILGGTMEVVMKKNGADYDECCYEEMTKTVGGQSQPQPYHNEPMRNDYEESRKGYNSNGLDQSGMKGK